MTGFGRTGKMFGFQNYDVQPDIVTFAKGISASWVPLSGIGCTTEIQVGRLCLCFCLCAPPAPPPRNPPCKGADTCPPVPLLCRVALQLSDRRLCFVAAAVCLNHNVIVRCVRAAHNTIGLLPCQPAWLRRNVPGASSGACLRLRGCEVHYQGGYCGQSGRTRACSEGGDATVCIHS
jgi:hypothetical protein